MKNICLIFLVILMLLNSTSIFCNDIKKIATIDMQLAISLHPKMALFDFNRIGFYKVRFGLSDKEFEEEIAKLKVLPDMAYEKRTNLERELGRIYRERQEAEIKYSASEEDYHKYVSFFNDSDSRIAKINKELFDLKWAIKNSDLTSREETIAMFNEIKKEIYEAIDEVVKEKKYKAVINSSVVLSIPYNNYCYIRIVEGLGIPSINFSLFNAFLLKNQLVKSKKIKSNSMIYSNWFELTQNNKRNNNLLMSPYPIVLSGGKNIISDVIKKIYEKYKIKTSIYEIVNSLLLKIGTLQDGQQIEKMVIIDE